MSDNSHDHAGHSHHITPQRTLLAVAGLLFFFMVLTVVAAVAAPEGMKANSFLMNGIALFIATVKATLVIAYFMGVKFTTRLVKIYAIGGFVWFFTLYVMMADYLTRPYERVPGWETESATALPRGSLEERE